MEEITFITFTVAVDDGNLGNDSQDFTITVTNVDDNNPIISSPNSEFL